MAAQQGSPWSMRCVESNWQHTLLHLQVRVLLAAVRHSPRLLQLSGQEYLLMLMV
jgi:hypothetical protein